MKIKISSDSTCDLGSEITDKYGVAVVPLNVILGTKSYLDGVEITPQNIFDYVSETGALPKTSATSVEQYERFFGELLKSCDCVIHYCLSSKISSCYNNAVSAAKGFNKKVFVVDSLALCSGQGLLVLKACDLSAEGKSPEEIVEITSAMREKLVISFVPDSLDYLHKGGRCSLASMMSAKILKLHPLIVMSDGEMAPRKKYIGSMEACLKRYIADAAEAFPNYDKKRCVIANAYADPELMKRIRKQVESLFSFDEILETVAGSTITSHCGKNTVGIFFVAQ